MCLNRNLFIVLISCCVLKDVTSASLHKDAAVSDLSHERVQRDLYDWFSSLWDYDDDDDDDDVDSFEEDSTEKYLICRNCSVHIHQTDLNTSSPVSALPSRAPSNELQPASKPTANAAAVPPSPTPDASANVNPSSTSASTAAPPPALPLVDATQSAITPAANTKPPPALPLAEANTAEQSAIKPTANTEPPPALPSTDANTTSQPASAPVNTSKSSLPASLPNPSNAAPSTR